MTWDRAGRTDDEEEVSENGAGGGKAEEGGGIGCTKVGAQQSDEGRHQLRNEGTSERQRSTL